MKKLIAVLTLFLAFSVGANAQQSKEQNLKFNEAAKLDAVKLTQLVALTPSQQDDFVRLFEMKYQTLNDNNISVERKKEMSRIVGMKIKATLNSDQLLKLDQNPEILANLTGMNQAAATVDKKN